MEKDFWPWRLGGVEVEGSPTQCTLWWCGWSLIPISIVSDMIGAVAAMQSLTVFKDFAENGLKPFVV